MKNFGFLISMLFISVVGGAQNQPVGWASLNGGTTGGQGGEVVRPTSRAQFVNFVKDDEPRMILVSDTIELNLYERVKVGSNKTIFGATQDAMLRFGGLEIEGNNVIVQNLVIGDFYDGDWDGKTNSADCITIYGQNVWVDHCWLWAASDGLLDVRSNGSQVADYVTVSNTRFNDHNKVSLIGSSDDNIQCRGKLRITFYNCWYDGTLAKGVHQRMPRIRFGDIHILNCYFEKTGSYGIAARFESDVVVENTYFRTANSPHLIDDFGKGIEDPDLVVVNNIYELCSGDQMTNGDAFEPSDFYSYQPIPVKDVPALAMNEAGTFNPSDNQPPTAATDTIDYLNMSGGVRIEVTKNDLDPDGGELRLAQIVNTPPGRGLIRDNQIIYAPASGATGIDTILYSLADTQGGIDTGMVLVFYEGISGVNVLGDTNLLKIYPNPADESVTVELLFKKSENMSFEMTDLNGKKLKTGDFSVKNLDEKLVISTKSLEAGSYFFSVKNGQKVYTKKIVVAH